MAKRKHTTASPEKIPMKTESTRNRRSSRKTDRSKAPRDRMGADAVGTACVGSANITVCEIGRSSTLVSFVQLRDQEQCHVDSSRGAARRIRLPLDIKYQADRRLDQVGISPQTLFGNLRLHLRPFVGETRFCR